MPAPALDTIAIGDEPAAWAGAGFTVVDDTFTVGPLAIRLTGSGGSRGIVGLGGPGIGSELAGLPTLPGGAEPVGGGDGEHENTVVGLDHLVVTTPDVDGTIGALEHAGLELRRERVVPAGDGAADEDRRQAFFWFGPTILELVGPAQATGDGPPRPWGLAFTAADLDTAARRLGDRLGPQNDAVQPGRRIATLRTRDLDISVPVAFMTPHRRTEDDGA